MKYLDIEREGIIRDYEYSYFLANGKLPKLTFNGSWIKINDSHSNYRLSQLPEFAKRLRQRLKEKGDNPKATPTGQGD